MSDLIDREELLRKMEERYCKIDNDRAFKGMTIPVVDGVRMNEIEYCIGMIQSEDVIEAEPVRHGHWVKCQGKSNIWYCSECGEKINYKQNRRTYNIPKVPVWQKNKRCRNCGAKMEGGAEDD